MSPVADQNPEQIARDKIDAMLTASGWDVQDKKAIKFNSGDGQAVREFTTDVGLADYVLFVGGKAIGVVEAEKETLGRGITTAEEQTLGYAKAKLKWDNNKEPLPALRRRRVSSRVSPTAGIRSRARGRFSTSTGRRHWRNGWRLVPRFGHGSTRC